MSDLLFGLDLDGVAYNWSKTARYMLREHIKARGETLPPSLSVAPSHWNALQESVSEEDWRWLFSDAIRAGLYRYGHVITGAIEGVQALSNLGDVMAITHRPKLAVHDTLTWLSFMFDKSPLSGVVIQSNGQKKSEVIPRPDIYIDDAVHVAQDILANTESSVILFDQPWNQDLLLGGKLHRAVGWDEVVTIAKMIKGEANYE